MMTFEKVKTVKTKPSEHNEQATFFDWLHLVHLRDFPEIHPLFFGVPNGMPLIGGKKNDPRRFAIINKMKREGMTPGVVDTLFLSGRGGHFGLAMEFKTPDKKNHADGGLSEAQVEFLSAARAEGFRAVTAYGSEQAEQIVSEYLTRPKTQDMVYSALKALEVDDRDTALRILQEIVLAW